MPKAIEYGIRGSSKKTIVQTHGSSKKTIKHGIQGSAKSSVSHGLQTPKSDFELKQLGRGTGEET